MKNINKHCNNISSGASLNLECDECDRKFTTKQGRNRHKTVGHKKENEKRDEVMKRNRSLEEKTINCNECKECNYTSR